MRLFNRSHGSEPDEPQQPSAMDTFIDWAKRRRQPLACAGCKQVKPPYVYTENDKEYCLKCARTNLTVLRLYPAGKRADDIKLEDLLADDDELKRRLGLDHDPANSETDAPSSEQQAS